MRYIAGLAGNRLKAARCREERKMGLFKRKRPETPQFPPEEYEPVLRCSFCTGEQTACMRRRDNGQLRELMLIRSPADLEDFCRTYQVRVETIRKVY